MKEVKTPPFLPQLEGNLSDPWFKWSLKVLTYHDHQIEIFCDKNSPPPSPNLKDVAPFCKFLLAAFFLGCPKPCRLRKHQFSSMLHYPEPSVTKNANGNYVFLTLSSSEIIVEQEIRMYDVNTIIGSIGGSLGLFIGFSFLQCSHGFLGMTRKLFNAFYNVQWYVWSYKEEASASPLEFIFSEFRFFMQSLLLPYTHLDLLFPKAPASLVKSPKRCRGATAAAAELQCH